MRHRLSSSKTFFDIRTSKMTDTFISAIFYLFFRHIFLRATSVSANDFHDVSFDCVSNKKRMITPLCRRRVERDETFKRNEFSPFKSPLEPFLLRDNIAIISLSLICIVFAVTSPSM